MIVLLVALLSGAMFYLSQGLSNLWALAWVAPAPLLWLAYTDAARWKVLAASLAAFAAGQIYLLQCYWGQIPLSVLAPFVAFIVLFPLSIWLAGEGLRRDSSLAALLAFPALWTALEFGIGKLSPHGTWGALGYAEVSFPAGIQTASLFGVHAVTFVLCLSANALALLARRRWAAGGVGVAVCALALIFGSHRRRLLVALRHPVSRNRCLPARERAPAGAPCRRGERIQLNITGHHANAALPGNESPHNVTD
ncbi:MAG: hypothetical protein ACREFT_14520 [Acetobacteraceae bacterium]